MSQIVICKPKRRSPGKGCPCELLPGQNETVKPGNQLLIVFTDEVGSTIKDEDEHRKYKGSAVGLGRYRKRLVSRRCKQFGKLVNNLLPTGAKVVKNVGDALVITLCADHGDPRLMKCLKALYDAWDKLKRNIRVAVHLAPVSDVATAKDLESFIDQVRKHAGQPTEKKLKDIWPALIVMAHDVFGAPMNRAARLAGVPHDALFVVSEEVVGGVVKKSGDGKKSDDQKKRDQLEIGRSYIQSELQAACDRVPLVQVKNVGRVTLDSPWWVCEVRPRSADPKLVEQFKSVQAIRVIEIAGDSVGEAHKEQAADRLQTSLIAPSGSDSFFVDLLFHVENVWVGYETRRDREHLWGLEEWKLRDPKSVSRQALLVVFSGCPDFATDEQLRKKKLALHTSEWDLQPTTLRVSEKVRYRYADTGNHMPGGKSYYLLEFQVRAGTVRPDDFKGVFKGIKPSYVSNGLRRLAHGLLEGETDGFVLFRAVGKNSIEVRNSLQQSQNAPGKGELSFLKRVAMISLYELSLVHKNGHPEVWHALYSLGKEQKP